MPLSDLASFGSLVSGIAVPSLVIYGFAFAIFVIPIIAAIAVFNPKRPEVDDALGSKPRYPGASIFQDHLEVVIRVNDWISEGNRGEDLPPREDFLRMPSRTIDSLIDQLGYFGYSGAIRKLYLKNEARINRILHRTRANSEERNSAMNAVLADVLIDLARQANIKIPQRN